MRAHCTTYSREFSGLVGRPIFFNVVVGAMLAGCSSAAVLVAGVVLALGEAHFV